MWSYSLREAIELRRDPIRGTLALLGTVILMFIMGYGITLDVDNLRFAVLDRDGSSLSRDYTVNLAGSRYFVERPPITDYADLDRRMQSGELSLAVELPPNFGRDVARGTPIEIGMWVDGANPQRGETIQSYAQAMHLAWLSETAMRRLGGRPSYSPVDVEVRFRYNPDVLSIIAMVPAMIPILLLMIPAMLTALSVVREKEMGSIVNLYVTPVTRSEFLIGKQIPYVVLGMVNFLLSIQYAGLLNPVSSLEGVGAAVGRILPTTYFLVISRGTFSKALGFLDLWPSLLPITASVGVLMTLCILLLKKQEN